MTSAFSNTVQRHILLALVVTASVVPLPGATLVRLSLDDMIAKSTAIVRGRVTGTKASIQGRMIYTHYAMQVSEHLKGGPQDGQDVVVPGGIANHLRQTVAGAPELKIGDEYVLFLWTGPSGLTQIIGLTQGVFTLAGTTATRPATAEVMLDPGTGQPVKDQTLVMNLSELRARIRAGSPGGAKPQ